MIQEQLDILRAEMEAHREPEKAINMAAYLKNHFECHGIKSPVRNEIQKKWFSQIKSMNLDHWDVAYNLWAMDQREYQYIAMDYLRKMPKKNYRIEDHLKIEELITTKSWWDSVDGLASNTAGTYFKCFPEQIDSVIQHWRNSDNMWLNRTCLIFQLKYRDELDFELLKSLIVQFQDNKEFFIQKAIGWSLRQYSKFNPQAVSAFIEDINLQGLARREASKYL